MSLLFSESDVVNGPNNFKYLEAIFCFSSHKYRHHFEINYCQIEEAAIDGIIWSLSPSRFDLKVYFSATF